ncbi:MAG: TonB-dependent receptor plug domain-containing protein, partial [Pseudomonadota bacterium]
MDCNPFKTRLLASSVFASAAFALGGVAIAQETPDDDVVETVTEVADSDAVQDTVVVTGSRIRRDSFSSTAPLQVIDGETIALTGQLNFSEALQSSPVVNGVQTTQSVSTQFVSDNGPGAQNIGLRGLGETRTLVLINSRRFAPAGIGGAPTAPDTGLIPSSMVERVDILLDGASSVYGSDAVSGVVNVILRDEFDGFSVGGQINMPQEDNGGSYSANFITGSSEGRTSFVFAGEYFKQEALNGCDRDWMRLNVDEEDWPDFAGQEICGSRDITEDGEFLGTGGQFQNFAAFPFGGIALGRPGTQDPFLGSVPNFESASLGANFNGLYRLSVPLNEDEQILNEFERSTFSFSSKTDLTDYIPDGEVFTEFNFAQRKTFFRGDYSIIDVVVTPDNPFLQEAGFLDPAGNPPPSNFTLRPASPTRNDQSTELNQYRFFTGLTGGLDFIGLDEWEFETFAGYTRSQGFSSQDAIL